MANEAQARLRINALLQQSGWHLTEFDGGKVNVRVENHLIMGKGKDDSLGVDFEKHGGRIDYLLYDDHDIPVCVLEAKSEGIHPLTGKEQAREYAKGLRVKFVILSNSKEHFFWNLEEGDPYLIDHYPTPQSLTETAQISSNIQDLLSINIGNDFLVETQYPEYKTDPLWHGSVKDSLELITKRDLCFLRDYQLRAIQSIQQAISGNKKRFLLEMATGTGKTSTSAAVIRLFIKSGNARRVLFLVDRLELENQAAKAFRNLLRPDITTVVYKERQDTWQRAEVVVTTIQSIMGKYSSIFSPTDFDLIISDEAHRLIAGEGPTRNVFDYFVGYKLGLTATPKDYLSNFKQSDFNETDPRELERRRQFSTYDMFDCKSGQPTFSYTLTDGVKDGFLVNPILVDCRTEVTTQLLSEEGFAAEVEVDPTGEIVESQFTYKDYEKNFESPATNRACMQTFIEEAEHDPITGEMGKTLVFCVSQNHAAKIAQILNEIAKEKWPGIYNSDFAMQVTSNTKDAQVHTIQFANNKLSGTTLQAPGYKSSKTRVCVTVGMMTTGYDCQDILNICLMRPVFSPSEFIQIKGRGTRIFTFKFAKRIQGESAEIAKKKTHFKLFDFFANCEYFQEKYDYTAKLSVPKPSKPITVKSGNRNSDNEIVGVIGHSTYKGSDITTLVQQSFLPSDGMRIDQELAKRALEKLAQEKTEQELARQAFEEYISKDQSYSDHADTLYQLFIMGWFNPQFLDDLRNCSISKYSVQQDLFETITNTSTTDRESIVSFITNHKTKQ